MWSQTPLSLQRLVYLGRQQAVIYKALKHSPTLGRNFETMHPLEWLVRMADHIPDPGKHRTLSYGYYANRMRRNRAGEEPAEGKVEEEPAKKRRCTASWARLAKSSTTPSRVASAEGKLRIVAYLHDTIALKQVLDHLGLSPPENAKPPPAEHEVVGVARR